MGSFFSGSKTQNSSQNSNTAPWQPQQSYILNGLGQAQNVYNQDKATGPYQGGYYSPINGMQTGAVNYANGWANGTGENLANGVAQNAQGLFGAATPYMGNAQNIEANGISGPNAGLMNTIAGYGTGARTGAQLAPNLQGAMTNAAISGAGYLNQGESNLMDTSNRALANPTTATINNATAYANASPVQSQINSTNAMIDKTLDQQTLPGVNREASLAGNLNSSRAGMEAAMAKDNAAVDKSNADAGLFSQAYGQGLSTAAQQGETGINQAIQANSSAMWPASMSMTGTGQLLNNQNQFNTNTALGAAQSGLDQGLNYAKSNADTQLSANQQLGNAASLGDTLANSAGNLANNNYNMSQTAGGVLQQNQNNILQGNLQQWQMNTNYPWQNLSNYFNMISKPLGSQSSGTSTTTQKNNPSIMSDIGGVVGLVGML